tara:strand:+ start:399 stop:641 length:243 start_codon:yes stop_codon:yes gene_type:complete
MKTIHKHTYWKDIDGKKVPYILEVVKKTENDIIVSSVPEGMPNPFDIAPSLSDARVKEDMKKAIKELEYEVNYLLPPLGE